MPATKKATMYGLRVQIPGRPPVTMALNQAKYHVSADAIFRRRLWPRPSRKPRLELTGRGMDDREDFLHWFTVEPPARQSWMEISIVETTVADPPRRRRLRSSHSRWKERYQRDLVKLSRRLRTMKSPPPPPTIPPPPSRAEYGLVVSIDGRVIGSAGVAGHGTVSITVLLKRRARRLLLVLNAHGGEHLGIETWRWRCWPWADHRELDVGQRIRIEMGPPDRLDLGEIREVRSYLARTKQEIRERLASVRRALRNADAQFREAAIREEKRPPPRSYPRAPIRAG
jgi:hypothetical protein